jgi:hypothetical protein
MFEALDAVLRPPAPAAFVGTWGGCVRSGGYDRVEWMGRTVWAGFAGETCFQEPSTA